MSRSLEPLIRESSDALQSARAGFRNFHGWQSLVGQSESGGSATASTRPKPYTPEAIAAFETAYREDPENIQVVHHLAIAHHALAWDLEKINDPGAEQAWKDALKYWRLLTTSPDFWAGLRIRLQAMRPSTGERPGTGEFPGADTGLIDRVRRGLYEDLLDIHVDFVRHYVETGSPERSETHVRIIQSADLPPAVKKRFDEKVFEAMTASVPEARVGRMWESAMTSVERFTSLFPDHLSALRLVTEIGRDWVAGISFIDRWDEIALLGQRIEDPASRLIRHPQLDQDSLAKACMSSLSEQFISHSLGRIEAIKSRGQRPKDQPYGSDLAPLSQQDYDDTLVVYELAIEWGRKSASLCSTDSTLVNNLAVLLNNRAVLLQQEIRAVKTSGVDQRTRLKTLENLLKGIVTDLEDAMQLRPQDELYQKNHEIFLDQLEDIKRQLLFNPLWTGSSSIFEEEDE
jgi:hypothetical protein